MMHMNKVKIKHNRTVTSHFFHFILSVSNKYNAIASINLIYIVQYSKVAWFPAQMFHDMKGVRVAAFLQPVTLADRHNENLHGIRANVKTKRKTN